MWNCRFEVNSRKKPFKWYFSFWTHRCVLMASPPAERWALSSFSLSDLQRRGDGTLSWLRGPCRPIGIHSASRCAPDRGVRCESNTTWQGASLPHRAARPPERGFRDCDESSTSRNGALRTLSGSRWVQRRRAPGPYCALEELWHEMTRRKMAEWKMTNGWH